MIPDRLAARVAEHQRRQAERRQDRTELDTARQHGLRTRHRNRLTHHTGGDAGRYPCPRCPEHPLLGELLDHLTTHQSAQDPT